MDFTSHRCADTHDRSVLVLFAPVVVVNSADFCECPKGIDPHVYLGIKRMVPVNRELFDFVSKLLGEEDYFSIIAPSIDLRARKDITGCLPF